MTVKFHKENQYFFLQFKQRGYEDSPMDRRMTTTTGRMLDQSFNSSNPSSLSTENNSSANRRRVVRIFVFIYG